ncbi:hypothetical protein [Flagellimonas nanhaiensis]|uniref:Portal protein n=1 Tax=Flagellimonas nanhaiensis TaxID=2292706 RepID=A0A371JKT5_9FLAO|nr:hypothetical protein [Allomuricauda nanhaiensis]RDY57573.1 hypothetical protein DX873_18620 [Allomuricauda nanhaiensis]
MDANLKPQDLTSYPDPLAPFQEKLTHQYAIKIATAIQSEWFPGGVIDKHSTFMKRHQWIREMRLYNRGEQDIEQYKKQFAKNEGDLKLLNMDWSVINIPEKFTNVVRSAISSNYYRLDVRSADRFTILDKKKNRDKHIRNMKSKDMLEKAYEILGIDYRPNGFVPEDEEELSLYSEIKDRPKHEIAEEILINYVKSISRWEQIKSETDKDLVLCDLQVARVYTDPLNGVQVEYIDPEAYGHSRVEHNDFNDAFYHFVMDTPTIGEVAKESGYDEATLRHIAKTYASQYSQNRTIDYDTCPINIVLDYKVHVMRFTYKTNKEEVYKAYIDKRNRMKKVAKRDSSYQVPEGAEKSRLSKNMDTWLEGNYIVGSNKYVYGYKECENLATDEMDRALPPFIAQASNLYKNKLRSFLSNIIPMCNEMQMQHLKIKHLISELKPDNIVINVDALADISSDTKGESKAKNWQTALSILQVKGVILEKTIDLGEEGVQRSQSARPQAQQQGSALTILLNTWAWYYNQIRETTGINPAMDGSLSADALVGVNQLMRLAGNSATKHIVDAATMFDKRICETISTRLKLIFDIDEAEHVREIYENAVGKHNLDALESLKNRHLHEFGFTIEMAPEQEELNLLREDLSIAIQEGTLDISEKAEIMRIAKSNIKQAIEFMRFLRKRRIKEKMKELEFNNKVQAENNIASAEAKQQGEVTMLQIKSQLKIQEEIQLSTIRLKEKQEALLIEEPEKKVRFEEAVFIETLKNQQVVDLARFKEQAKDDRLDEQSTQQSALIDQRKRDNGPLNFKKSFDLGRLTA